MKGWLEYGWIDGLSAAHTDFLVVTEATSESFADAVNCTNGIGSNDVTGDKLLDWIICQYQFECKTIYVQVWRCKLSTRQFFCKCFTWFLPISSCCGSAAGEAAHTTKMKAIKTANTLKFIFIFFFCLIFFSNCNYFLKSNDFVMIETELKANL